MIAEPTTNAPRPRKAEPPVPLAREAKPLAPTPAAALPGALSDMRATQTAGPILTSTAGDGFGASPALPSPASDPAAALSGVRAAQSAGPAATALGGQVLTSSAGDGFGAGAPVASEGFPRTALPPAPAGAPTALPPTAAAPATSGVAPRLDPTDPNNALTAQTIQPGSALDRLQVAREQYDTFVQGTDPAYQSALRDANRLGAAGGGLGSGQLRTRFGDLAANRGTELDVKRDTVFQDAMLGGVDDARFSTGVAQQQQGFQNQQQQQAFMNELSRLGFDDSMLNSAFGRSLQTWMAGQTGGTGSASGAVYGANVAGQGNNALDALANLTRSNAAATTPPGAPPLPALPPPPPRSSTVATQPWSTVAGRGS